MTDKPIKTEVDKNKKDGPFTGKGSRFHNFMYRVTMSKSTMIVLAMIIVGIYSLNAVTIATSNNPSELRIMGVMGYIFALMWYAFYQWISRRNDELHDLLGREHKLMLEMFGTFEQLMKVLEEAKAEADLKKAKAAGSQTAAKKKVAQVKARRVIHDVVKKDTK